MIDYKTYYAQNREDIILSAFFSEDEKGFYVDVGANDPNKDSVTKYFYQKGWRGINIEPIKRLHAKLERERPRDINLNIGVGEKEAKLRFREYLGADGLSTFSSSMKEEHEDNTSELKYDEYDVEVVPLTKLFEQHDVKSIQFMKVDVEGYEYEALKGNDWRRYRPEVICIEAAHIKKDWHEFLEKKGYQQVFNDGLNDYLVDSTIKHPRRLSYIQTVLPRPLVPAGLQDSIKQQNRENIEYKHELTRLKLKVSELKQQKDFLQQELRQSKRLRSLAKQTVKSIDAALIAYIDTLDRPHKNKLVPFISKAGTAKRLLHDLHHYDLTHSHNIHPRNGRLSHALVRGTYMGLTRPVAKVGRKMLHNLREQRGKS